MELDDLKRIADQSASDYKPINDNIMELIHLKSQGPLAGLAQKLKAGLFFFPLAAILFSAAFVSSEKALHSALRWMLLGILFIEFLNSLFNYGLVKKLQNRSGSTKANTLSKVNRLTKSLKRQLSITVFLYSCMAAVLEITMYYHADTNFSGWFQTPIPLRILFYIVFLIVQFMLKKHFYNRQFGGYIKELNNLIGQFE